MNTGSSATPYPTDEYASEAHKHWLGGCQEILYKKTFAKIKIVFPFFDLSA